MRLAQQELPEHPQIPPTIQILGCRASLILEEALETVSALGFKVNHHLDQEGKSHLILVPDLEKIGSGLSLVEIVDGCCDLAVVTTGTLSACGVADLSVQNEVNHNNLSKFGPGHSIREDGKLIKPPDHKPPDLLSVLKAQGYKPPILVS